MALTDEDRRMLGALGQALSAVAEVPVDPTPPVTRSDYGSDLPAEIDEIIDMCSDGRLDPYIEILLSHLHNRKKRLRGTRGF